MQGDFPRAKNKSLKKKKKKDYTPNKLSKVIAIKRLCVPKNLGKI